MGDTIPFKPRKVTEAEVFNRANSVYTAGTISLLEANPNDWFQVHEYVGDDYTKQANTLSSMSRYWSMKLLRTDNITLQYKTTAYRKTKTVKLYARIVREEK